jgi:hypothetical protein
MDDIYAWAEDQREEKRDNFIRFLNSQRQIWTPAHIFNRCCVKWLADGTYSNDDAFYGEDFCDPHSFRGGCRDGHVCRYDHPNITLRFDDETKKSIATLSHRLDPFVEYFDGLVAAGSAKPRGNMAYELDGYIRHNETALRNHTGFGSHLVEVDKASLEASDQSYTADQRAKEEAEERNRKRPRLLGETDQQFALLEEAMGIVQEVRLQKDLEVDPMSLYCMRSVCKLFKRIATDIGRTKANSLDLSITPLVNGMWKRSKNDTNDAISGYDEETYDVLCDDPFEANAYTRKDIVTLDFRDGDEGPGYYPIDTSKSGFSWDSGELFRDADEDDYDNDYDYDDSADYAYNGQMMRVYWHPKKDDPIKSPTRMSASLWGRPKPPLGVRLCAIRVKTKPTIGRVVGKGRGIILEYDVLESSAEEIQVDNSSGEEDDDDDDLDHNENKEKGEKKTWMIRHQGKIRIVKARVDYGILVRKHAREIKFDVERKHRKLQEERPLTDFEKEYKKLVDLAAGEYIDGFGYTHDD